MCLLVSFRWFLKFSIFIQFFERIAGISWLCIHRMGFHNYNYSALMRTSPTSYVKAYIKSMWLAIR